jgi:hypothetical protein
MKVLLPAYRLKTMLTLNPMTWKYGKKHSVPASGSEAWYGLGNAS